MTGPRLLAAGWTSAPRWRARDAFAEEIGVSSLHLLFPSDTDMRALREAGFLVRESVQFHWRNAGHADFDAFLASMSHDKRKKIRQDRKKVAAAGLRHRWLRGDAIGADELDFFYQCYRTTYFQHGNPPYLSADFFHRAHRDQPDAFVLILAERDGAPVAAALNLAGGDALYGRYWGATEYVPGLHFETCYMQAIAYCIAHGFARFEGGAQGEHKMARGLLPTPPGPPTGSPTRASPTRSNASWTRKPRRSKATWTNWKRTHRSSRTRPIVLVKVRPATTPRSQHSPHEAGLAKRGHAEPALPVRSGAEGKRASASGVILQEPIQQLAAVLVQRHQVADQIEDAVVVGDQQRLRVQAADVFLAAQREGRLAPVGLDLPDGGGGEGRHALELADLRHELAAGEFLFHQRRASAGRSAS